MKRLMQFISVLVLFVFVAPAYADHQTDFALFSEPDGATGARCGARRLSSPGLTVAFRMHINVTNRGAVDGFFRVTYADADTVDYFIKAKTTVGLSEAGGRTLGVNDIISVTGDGIGGSELVGSVSLQTHNAQKHPALGPGPTATTFCVTF